MVINVDKILLQRDVDAALYLLTRMLDLEFGEKRKDLELLFKKIGSRRTIDENERLQVISLYREVVG